MGGVLRGSHCRDGGADREADPEGAGGGSGGGAREYEYSVPKSECLSGWAAGGQLAKPSEWVQVMSIVRPLLDMMRLNEGTTCSPPHPGGKQVPGPSARHTLFLVLRGIATQVSL